MLGLPRRHAEERLPDALLAEIYSFFKTLLYDSTLRVQERVEAGIVLAGLGDPRDEVLIPEALAFCHVPAGPFWMGEGKERHRITVLDYDYYVARYPVTVAQFQAYLEATDQKPGDTDSLKGVANHPVVWVNWYEASAYAAWLSRRLRVVAPEHLAGPELAPKERSVWEGLLEGRLVASLPSEVEWEKAARGPDGKRRWPWPGDEPDPNRANYHDSGIDATSAVGCFPGGRSPFGAEEMSGNVWEWTRSLWGEKWNKPSFDYSYDPHDGREDEETPDAILRVLRGGAFNLNEDNVRCAFRDLYDPDDRSYRIGFRVFLRPRSIDESTDSEL